MAEHQREWEVFIENREAAVEALRQGKYEGIRFAHAFSSSPLLHKKPALSAGYLTHLSAFTRQCELTSLPVLAFLETGRLKAVR